MQKMWVESDIVKNLKSELLFLVFIALVLSGCANEPCPDYNHLQVATFYGPHFQPVKKPYGTVTPFDSAKDVNRPYQVIAFMSCEANAGDEAKILTAMLYHAADIGADGIILNA